MFKIIVIITQLHNKSIKTVSEIIMDDYVISVIAPVCWMQSYDRFTDMNLLNELITTMTLNMCSHILKAAVCMNTFSLKVIKKPKY